MTATTTGAAATRNPADYGLILDEIKPQDLVLGSSNELAGKVLVPDGQWDKWLPDVEYQDTNGVEPYACVSFALTNVIEMLERHEFGIARNYSDRFLATVSGTKESKGNSPQKVSETIRKVGCITETDLPFDSTVTSFDMYYAPIKQSLYNLALGFVIEYEFGHEYVPTGAKLLMEALKYSPVAMSVYAWVKDDKGIYYRPKGATDNHLTVCYGYKENEYWLIFDSYADDGKPFKRLRWTSLPMQAKRLTLHRNVKNESAWTRFVALFRQLLGL